MRPAEVGAMRRLLGRRFSAPCQQDRRTLTIEDVRDLLAIPRTELKAHGLRRVADEARRAATAAILHPWGGPLLRHDEPGLADDWDEYDDDELCDICGADWWTFDRWNDCPSCGT